MMNQHNTFKDAVADLNYPLGTVIAKEKEDLTPRQKKTLLTQTKMYIQLQEIIKKITPELAPAEEIIGYMPFTNEANSGMGTSGIMGMTYVTTPEAKNYRDNFLDLRGNRLMIFTQERMIFMVIIDFLETQSFFSHPYESIDGIRFEKHQVGYFDWDNRKFLPKRKKLNWYTLDFQAGKNVFTEILQEKEAQQFASYLTDIPKLKAVTADNRTHRKNLFDYLFSNTHLAYNLFNGFFILLIASLLIYFAYLVLTGKTNIIEWIKEMNKINAGTSSLMIVLKNLIS